MVLVIIGLSVAMSLLHGLVRELMSLASWIVAYVVAQALALGAGGLFASAIDHPSLRLLAGFVTVFVLTLIAMTLLSLLLSRLVKGVGLGPVDRILGAAFGFVRGLAIVMLGVLLSGLTSLPRQDGWRQAASSPPLVMLANIVKGWLPYDISKRISYQ